MNMSKRQADGSRHRDRRRIEATERKVLGAITPEKRIEILDERLGKGVGAKKERARLEAML